MQTLLKIVTDGCGHIIIVNDEDEELYRMKAGTGEPGAIDEFTDEGELTDAVRSAWRSIGGDE